MAQTGGPQGVWRVCVRRALAKRCPQCGRGRLFGSTFRLHERCGHCGLVYRREPGAELGSMTLVAVVTELLAGALFLLVWALTDWGAGTALALTVPVTVAFCYACQPYCMALWVAVDYLTDLSNGEWWAKPRL